MRGNWLGKKEKRKTPDQEHQAGGAFPCGSESHRNSVGYIYKHDPLGFRRKIEIGGHDCKARPATIRSNGIYLSITPIDKRERFAAERRLEIRKRSDSEIKTVAYRNRRTTSFLTIVTHGCALKPCLCSSLHQRLRGIRRNTGNNLTAESGLTTASPQKLSLL